MHFVTMHRQVDGSDGYVYSCPRGDIRIDQAKTRRELTFCLGYRAPTPAQQRRDRREAMALHQSVLAEQEESFSS